MSDSPVTSTPAAPNPTQGDSGANTAQAASTGAQAPAPSAPTPPPAQPDASSAAQDDGGKPPEASQDDPGANDKGDKPKPDGAPEQYETFKAPEGQEFSPEVIGAFSEVAKELNLSQEGAQKLLDKMGPVLETRNAEAAQKIRAEWQSSALADKEFGGDQARLDANLGIAKKALDQFATPEFSKWLADTGMGNHPEMIRTMYRVGKAVSEDTFVKGNRQSEGTPGPKTFSDHANALYPTMRT